MTTDTDALPSALIVDDEPGIRELLSAFLERYGFDCVEAESGDEALDWLAVGLFDLVVLDIRMAGGNGFQVLQEARQGNPETCMLMVSGLATPQAFAQAQSLGADGFLTKPFTFSQLGAAVRQAYDERERDLDPAPEPRPDRPLGERRYPFTVEAISQVPDRPGVYVLYRDADTLLIGCAEGVSETLLSQLRAHRRNDVDALTWEATHFAFEVDIEPQPRHAALLVDYRAGHGGAVPAGNEEPAPAVPI